MPKEGKATKQPWAGEAKTKAAKGLKAKKPAKSARRSAATLETARVIGSEVVFDGPLFRVDRDTLIEPGGSENKRDIVRHNGSAVILAIDGAKKNPWIVMERQYRHAAGQYLWELPAGKIEPGEDPMEGAQRELAEETGYRAKKWRPTITFYPSPGFLGESMTIYLAEGLTAGDATPEEDEKIELRLVKLSEVLKMIGKGAILDGKTLCGVLWYARFSKAKGRKKLKKVVDIIDSK
ncbi:MAG: NUDIX hydrolase [Terracidiphilus sp.]